MSLKTIQTFDIFPFSRPIWFKHILFMAEHEKGLGRAKRLCLALSMLTLHHSCEHKGITLRSKILATG